MRNCLILGSGRSGTSLTAGMVQRAGYHLGEPLQPPNRGNPLGRFESIEVNAINEAILGPALPRRRPHSFFDSLFRRHIPLRNQRWLASIPLGQKFSVAPDLLPRMARLVEQQPYCLKDPRFSYTLPAWRPLLVETVFICVFRHPAETAVSILREHQEEPRLHSLDMNRQRALQVWTLMYRHILELHCQEGQWLFVHYGQMLSGAGVGRIDEFLGAALDRSLINPGLQRSLADGQVAKKTAQVYARLCALAGWTGS